MLEPLDNVTMLVFGDEDKDSTLEGLEDFDPDAESSLSITFAFSRKGGGLSTHTVYLDEEKLKNKRVIMRLHKIQVAAAELLLIGEKL